MYDFMKLAATWSTAERERRTSSDYRSSLIKLDNWKQASYLNQYTIDVLSACFRRRNKSTNMVIERQDDYAESRPPPLFKGRDSLPTMVVLFMCTNFNSYI